MIDRSASGSVIDLSLGLESAPRVLVVDDDANNRYLVESQLRPSGCVVTTAEDGESGLRMAVADVPDLILVDVRMPGLDGYEVVARLKANPVTRAVPVVLMTAYNDLHAKIRGLEAGADDFLFRPVEYPELVARARSLIRAGNAFQQLAQSEAKYRAVVEQMPAITYMMSAGPSSTPLYVSPQITTLLGVPVSEWMSDARLWEHLLHPDDRERVAQAMARARAGDGRFQAEHRLVGRDGRVVWGQHAALFAQDGRLYGAFLDISERKRAEEALRSNEALLGEVLQTAFDAVITLDDVGCMTLFNMAAEHMFGYAPDQVLGRHFNMLLANHSTNGHPDSHLNSTPAWSLGHSATLVGRRADATTFPIEASVSGTTVDAQHFSTIIMRDITDRVRAEESLLLAKQVAEAANKQKSEFLANISHELRTPLNAIIGFSELLADRDSTIIAEEQRRVFLGHIQNSGHHLLGLINDLLDISKVEAGAMELSIDTVSIASCIDECCKIVRPMADAKHLTLQAAYAADLEAQADASRIKQVLLNLLSNAVKFTSDGGLVDVTADAVADQIRVSVRDTGVGINEADQELIFEQFRQVRSSISTNQTGTGLGLALARTLVELHGGRIWVDSAPGRGSSFTFTLPRVQPTR